MLFFYNLGIALYYFVLKMASFFHPKARLWIDGRRDFFSKLKTQLPDNQNIIWFHCASLGEFEQGRPLIEAIKKEQPQYKILLTFFSPSGYEIRKNYAFADYVCYLPLDTARNAQQFLDIVQPKMAFFIKYEFWYHFLKNLHARQIPTYLVAAIFRPNQVFFKWYGIFFRKMLDFFTIIFLQEHSEMLDKEEKTIFSSSEKVKTRYLVMGDTRIDRVAQLAADAPTLPLIKNFCAQKKVIIAGSTWAKDDVLLKEYMQQNNSTTNNKRKYIVAPHQIPSETLQKDAFPLPSLAYSALHNASASQTEREAAEVLYIDNIGMLSSIYQYGHIAYIGGGFGAGIHNTLEPIAFGLPVIFGPKYQKFAEANYLVENKGGFCVHNVAELAAAIAFIEANYEQCQHAAKSYIEQHQGATKKIMNVITERIMN